MRVINIAREFSEFPVGRYLADGPDTGERFRIEFLDEPMSKREPLTIELSGTDGYGSSFLDEAFGGVVRKFKLSQHETESLLTFEADADDVSFVREIQGYIADACADVARNK